MIHTGSFQFPFAKMQTPTHGKDTIRLLLHKHILLLHFPLMFQKLLQKQNIHKLRLEMRAFDFPLMGKEKNTSNFCS